MIQFNEVFPDEEIVAALRRQLGWTYFKVLIPLKDPLKRDFYAEMCLIERWYMQMLLNEALFGQAVPECCHQQGKELPPLVLRPRPHRKQPLPARKQTFYGIRDFCSGKRHFFL